MFIIEVTKNETKSLTLALSFLNNHNIILGLREQQRLRYIIDYINHRVDVFNQQQHKNEENSKNTNDDHHKNNQKSVLDFSDSMQYDDKLYYSYTLFEECLYLKKLAFQEIAQNHINLPLILETFSILRQKRNILHSHLMNLLSYNQSNTFLYEIIELFEKTLQFDYKLSKKLNNNEKRSRLYGEEMNKLQYYTEDSCIIYISLVENIGVVQKTTKNLYSVVPIYNSVEVVGKNINYMQPKIISRIHDNILMNFITKQNVSLAVKNYGLIIGVDQQGWAIPYEMKLQTCMIGVSDFGACTWIKQIVDTSFYMMVDFHNNFLIHTMSRKMYSMLFQNYFSSSFVQKIGLASIMPSLHSFIHKKSGETYRYESVLIKSRNEKFNLSTSQNYEKDDQLILNILKKDLYKIDADYYPFHHKCVSFIQIKIHSLERIDNFKDKIENLMKLLKDFEEFQQYDSEFIEEQRQILMNQKPIEYHSSHQSDQQNVIVEEDNIFINQDDSQLYLQNQTSNKNQSNLKQINEQNSQNHNETQCSISLNNQTKLNQFHSVSEDKVIYSDHKLNNHIQNESNVKNHQNHLNTTNHPGVIPLKNNMQSFDFSCKENQEDINQEYNIQEYDMNQEQNYDQDYNNNHDYPQINQDIQLNLLSQDQFSPRSEFNTYRNIVPQSPFSQTSEQIIFYQNTPSQKKQSLKQVSNTNIPFDNCNLKKIGQVSKSSFAKRESLLQTAENSPQANFLKQVTTNKSQLFQVASTQQISSQNNLEENNNKKCSDDKKKQKKQNNDPNQPSLNSSQNTKGSQKDKELIKALKRQNKIYGLEIIKYLGFITLVIMLILNIWSFLKLQKYLDEQKAEYHYIDWGVSLNLVLTQISGDASLEKLFQYQEFNLDSIELQKDFEKDIVYFQNERKELFKQLMITYHNSKVTDGVQVFKLIAEHKSYFIFAFQIDRLVYSIQSFFYVITNLYGYEYKLTQKLEVRNENYYQILANSVQTTEDLEKIEKDVNQLIDEVIQGMYDDLFVSQFADLLVSALFSFSFIPIYYFVSTKITKILALFATFPPEKITTILNSIGTTQDSLDQIQNSLSHTMNYSKRKTIDYDITSKNLSIHNLMILSKSNNYLNNNNNMNSNLHNNPSSRQVSQNNRNKLVQSNMNNQSNRNKSGIIRVSKNKNISTYSKLPYFSFKAFIYAIAFFLFNIIYSFTIGFSMKSFLKDQESNQEFLTTINQIHILTVQLIEIEYIVIHTRLENEIDIYLGYLGAIMHKSSLIKQELTNLNDIVQKQSKISRYRQNDFMSYLDKVMEKNSCQAVHENQQFLKLKGFDLQKCERISKKIFQSGFLATTSQFLQHINQNVQMLVEKDFNQFMENLNAFLGENGLYEQYYFKTYQSFIVDSIIGMVEEITQEEYDSILLINEMLIIMQVIAFVSSVYLVYIRFYNNCFQQIISAKQLLDLIDINYLHENQYINSYLKSNQS